jgi:uncharacterized protein YjbI with pentapeptide repeats
MANIEHLATLRKGVEEWNRWRAATNNGPVDLSDADLTGFKLNHVNFLRANLTNSVLRYVQLEHAHLKDANLTRAVLDQANLEHVNARDAIFDEVEAPEANFEVGTLRGARFRNANLRGARFHRAYLRNADLTDAALTEAWLRFATFDRACCRRTDFVRADLRYASMVETDLRGANLDDVAVYGLSAWKIKTDASTYQDLIVGAPKSRALRVQDLHTAQFLALMLDDTGIRSIFHSVTSKLVLVLGSFSPIEKTVLDGLRSALRQRGYVAVTFDFERPAERDFAETVAILAGLSRFVIADFTDAKEVRAEVLLARSQFRRVPIVPIARVGAKLPITMINYFSEQELRQLVRYDDLNDLLLKLQPDVIDPAEARASSIAEYIAKSEDILRAT